MRIHRNSNGIDERWGSAPETYHSRVRKSQFLLEILDFLDLFDLWSDAFHELGEYVLILRCP